jgi:hypothetical protein
MSSAQRDHSQPSISVSSTQMFTSGQPEVHEVELAWQLYPASQSQPASRLDPRAQLALPDRLEVVRQESLVARTRTSQLRGKRSTLPWSDAEGTVSPLVITIPVLDRPTSGFALRVHTAAAAALPSARDHRRIERALAPICERVRDLPRSIRRGPSAHPPWPAAVRRATSLYAG